MAKGFAATFLFFLFTLHVSAQTTNIERLNSLREVSRIAFGSCNDQNDPQPLWQDLQKTNPDLFIWNGDAIYADWETRYDMVGSYTKQSMNPDYMMFKSKTPVIGTWDDHDYAYDNANGTLATKRESQRHYLDFVEEPVDSVRRLQEGIYTSYELGVEGRKVKIILLDNRYFKDLDPEYPILGRTQWNWLETELKNSTADMHIIATGTPIFSPLLPYTDEWGENMGELNRLLGLIKKYNPKGVLFLTGDKHFAAIYQNYGQLEFMSSGMTHVAPRSTWWYLGRQYPRTFFGLNYGVVDIDWKGSNPKIKLSIRGTAGSDIHPTHYVWNKTKWDWLR